MTYLNYLIKHLSCSECWVMNGVHRVESSFCVGSARVRLLGGVVSYLTRARPCSGTSNTPGVPVPAGLTEKGVEVRGVHHLAQDCTAKCLGQDLEKNGEEGKSHVGVSVSGCSRVRLIIL